MYNTERAQGHGSGDAETLKFRGRFFQETSMDEAGRFYIDGPQFGRPFTDQIMALLGRVFLNSLRARLANAPLRLR